MTEAEFWASTPRYFAARQKAWIETQRREWERARFTGWLAVLPHVDTKKRGLSVTDLYRFEWDEKPKPKFDPIDLEKMRKFQEEAKLIFEKQFGVKFPEATSNATNGENQRT